jgi:hypothetical protein
MKTNEPRRAALPVPTLSTIAPGGEGGGIGESDQTTVQEKPGKKPNWRCGAPSGNRNAAKTVHSLSTILKRIRALKRRVRAAIAQVPE